ncbi:hypothetical protein L1887_40460 [Cichorium endivia]|nr:hypothetical protein L1887_40460 [Cichorium endivia]
MLMQQNVSLSRVLRHLFQKSIQLGCRQTSSLRLINVSSRCVECVGGYWIRLCYEGLANWDVLDAPRLTRCHAQTRGANEGSGKVRRRVSTSLSQGNPSEASISVGATAPESCCASLSHGPLIQSDDGCRLAVVLLRIFHRQRERGRRTGRIGLCEGSAMAWTSGLSHRMSRSGMAMLVDAEEADEVNEHTSRSAAGMM